MGKRFLILLVSLVAVSAVFANGNVAGLVRLGPNGPGADGATVIMQRNHPADSLVATTDAEGHFAFTDIASGGWFARAFLAGHLPSMPVGVNVPSNGGTVNVTIILGPPLGDPGTVAGLVFTSGGEPAVNAFVRVSQIGNMHGFNATTNTNAAGAFSFPAVPAGAYNINAGLMGEGFAADVIEVVANQTTNVTLTLGSNHHGEPHDSLTVVELSGTAIVIPPDETHPMPWFFIDVDGDGEGDYRLSFGPPWYDPNGPDAPNRPLDGDEITIVGGLMTYGQPPMVVVFEINGLVWRVPGQGHGGHGGGHHGLGCDPEDITSIEVEGTAVVNTVEGPHGEIDRYGIDTNADGEADYALMFGPPSYDPNGEEAPNRPLNGDAIAIVGGLMDCENMPVGAIIVYEINGMFWREPGNSDGFEIYGVTLNAGDPAVVPSTHLMATNYPNPFNPSTSISYSLPANSLVSLKVFDITGREVATLVNESQAAGIHSAVWDAAQMPSGIYLYRLTAGAESFTGRMVLMK